MILFENSSVPWTGNNMKKLVKSEEKRSMIPAGLEQVTIRVLGAWKAASYYAVIRGYYIWWN